MSQFDLLTAVQPSDGWFAIVGINKTGGIQQEFAETREEANELIQRFTRKNLDVYFGVAKYATSGKRTKANVKALKAFWLDIDCGKDKAEVNAKTGRPKGYINKKAGVAAVMAFCKITGLPDPILVDSGRGLHAYWALTEEITREQWEPVAARLAQLCVTQNLYTDPVVFEAARILRVPGTWNYKGDIPLNVEVVYSPEPVDFGVFKTLLGIRETPAAVEAGPVKELTALGKSLVENRTSNFDKIIRVSKNGAGCKQLLDCCENSATLSEPRWFDALSVAAFCQDRETAIHAVSAGHPDYTPEAAEAKTHHISAPHSCETFEKTNPGGCDGCPLKGKGRSPIGLGRVIVEAEDNVVVEEPTEEGEEPETYIIPEYPFPFFRGKTGGVYMKAKDDESEDVLVYPNDLYVVKRMDDPVQGEVILFRLHLPQDAVRQLVVPVSTTTDKSELRRVLASRGVACFDKQVPLLMYYVTAAINELQHKRKTEQMRVQFGWADKDTKFIIGDREITPTGTFYSPPSSTTKALAEHLTPAGTLEKWKEVFALYERPGLEASAFGALTAFGSPLLKFTGQSGAIINLIHPRSGTGKSTVLHMCNSVYGHPKDLCTTVDDTANARILRLGILRHLPYTMDEITNLSAKEFSPQTYSMSAGKGKERMKQHTNELRSNATTWQCISLCSANASFYEKLSASKNSPDGEMMRLIEYKIDYSDVISTATAKQMFDHQLMENYGHAGDIYAAWLVAHADEAKTTLLRIQAKIDKELRLTQRERFWSAVLACNITGGLIAKQLGLINWDMKAIYMWATDMVQELRTEVVAPVIDIAGVLGDYLNRHIAQNTLIVNDLVDRRSNMPALPTQEPRGDLLVRMEPDTKKIFIVSKAFKEDCVKYQINYKDTVAQLKSRGVLIGAGNKRMSKGMKLVTPGVHALTIDASNKDFFDMDNLVVTATRADAED